MTRALSKILEMKRSIDEITDLDVVLLRKVLNLFLPCRYVLRLAGKCSHCTDISDWKYAYCTGVSFILSVLMFLAEVIHFFSRSTDPAAQGAGAGLLLLCGQNGPQGP
jgi:hypothetical protein